MNKFLWEIVKENSLNNSTINNTGGRTIIIYSNLVILEYLESKLNDYWKQFIEAKLIEDNLITRKSNKIDSHTENAKQYTINSFNSKATNLKKYNDPTSATIIIKEQGLSFKVNKEEYINELLEINIKKPDYCRKSHCECFHCTKIINREITYSELENI